MIPRFLLLPIAMAALLAAPTPAAAHAELVSSSPAAGEELETAPPEVAITFDGELDPADSGFTVSDASGAEVGRGEVDLDVAERNELRGTVAIESAGTYTVAWTATAADGHAEKGTFTFTLADPPRAAEPPDTAVGAPKAQGWTALGGLLMVVVALLLIAARLATRRTEVR